MITLEQEGEQKKLTVSAAFWLISVEAAWAWAADGWVTCCWTGTSGWPGAGLLGEGWAAGCWAWPACLRRDGRWGGAGLDGVLAVCWEVVLTTEGDVVCCWTIGCACGWMSALVTGDTAVAADIVSAPEAAAGCISYWRRITFASLVILIHAYIF